MHALHQCIILLHNTSKFEVISTFILMCCYRNPWPLKYQAMSIVIYTLKETCTLIGWAFIFQKHWWHWKKGNNTNEQSIHISKLGWRRKYLKYGTFRQNASAYLFWKIYLDWLIIYHPERGINRWMNILTCIQTDSH